MREPVEGKMERKETNGKVKQTFAYNIKLKNMNKVPVDVIIKDQSPLAQDKEIEIKNIDLSAGKYDLGTGEVLWAMRMNSNASKDLGFSYSIKYPKEKERNGSLDISISSYKRRGVRRVKSRRACPSF
ncbi:MAG: DUF4139 domain-containing protein [Flavobacteriales bacterium]|nr:DUF4139 domain-containing protein [Flavobacteriales bacterium]